MKYRLLDLLECPTCGSSDLTLTASASRGADVHEAFDEVWCSRVCAFKQRSLADGDITSADCRECYDREITEGTVVCGSGHSWSIVGGIPRFLPDMIAGDLKKAQDTFSYEWKMFRFGERNWGQDIEHRKELFLDAVGAKAEDLRGKRIFDAGCGSGLLSIEMAESFGMEVIALDLAFGVESAYRHNKSPHVHFIQGSVLDPPVRSEVFDYVYCAGVLVACPDVREGFKGLVRTVKRTGRCFIWVYHPITKEYYPTDHRKLATYNWIRRNVTSKLPIKVQYYLYLSLIPAFLAKQSFDIASGRKSTRITWKEKMQNLFDFFSPKYQHRHEPDEVSKWFSQAGLEDVTVRNVGHEGFGVCGERTITAPSRT